MQTSKVDITQGVLQGDPLSPPLFLLFISDLESYIRKNQLEVIFINRKDDVLTLLYAVDLVMFAHYEIDMQRKLRALENYCSENKLLINATKTKIVIFHKGKWAKSNRNYTCQNEIINSTNKYEYLEVPFTSREVFSEEVNYFASRGYIAIRKMIYNEKNKNEPNGDHVKIIIKHSNADFTLCCRNMPTKICR